MFGKSQLKTDIFLRTLGWKRLVEREYEQMDAESRAILQSYAAGVNAYLAGRSGVDVSLEYAVLGLMNSSYTIEPWTPVHSLTWAKAMAWDLRGNMDEEADRTRLLRRFSPEQIAQLYPPYAPDQPVIVTSPPPSGQHSTPQVQLAALPWDEIMVQAASVETRARAVDALIGPTGSGIGSNNWVISGRLTASGKPLLANDPHLGPQMPSIWYEVGLYCTPRTEACPYQVTGFSFAGAPGVVIGHNDRIAWGFTNVGPDVQDIYIERINPYAPDQYEVNGDWVDMEVIEETIQVAGEEPVKIRVRSTRHGPVLWDDQEQMDEFHVKAGIDLPFAYRLSIRWTALEDSSTFPAIWKINKARNWQEFREGARDFKVPAQNFVYADVDGNIGYQMPGMIPIRPQGASGTIYIPGWTDEYEWQGYIPFEQLPSVYNPPEGFIVTANNAVVSPDYPYLITYDWDYGFRARRIREMITTAPAPMDIAYMQKMQADGLPPGMDFILPLLTRIETGDASQDQARAVLQGWDGQFDAASAAAALYAAFWKHLLLRTFADDLPEDLLPDGGSRWYMVMRGLVDQPDSPWWDDQATEPVEQRDDIARLALADAVTDLTKRQGSSPARWAWGDLHTITFKNQTLGKSGVAPIEALFNRGPFPTSGGESIVNATGWSVDSDSYAVDWVPSMRMIVDLSALENSLAVHTTGQSGHAFHPHYQDMVNLWRGVEYHPMRWLPDEIASSAKAHLMLKPGGESAGQ
jgi:penicillin G amidase